jgi:hypothetical protein
MNDQNYLSIGFNKFLTKLVQPKVQLEDDSSIESAPILGNQTYNGETVSPDGKMSLKWDENRVIFSDRARNRVILGDLDMEGVYGIRVVDNAGVTHFEESA